MADYEYENNSNEEEESDNNSNDSNNDNDNDPKNFGPSVHQAQIEDLKFKLAQQRTMNANLRRRVSIAGMEKEKLSVVWENPRVTIQMVSEFIERLPLNHKEKIWNRHAMGAYIESKKILHTLHSFVALCIKIKDRTAIAPSRQDIEDKLQPFVNIIQSRISSHSGGMSLDEFNNELHYWILEPVSGLIMTSEEEQMWQSQIDSLKEQLIEANKQNDKIRRQSQADLTVLLDRLNKKDEELKNSQLKNSQNMFNEIEYSELKERCDKYENDINNYKKELLDLRTDNNNQKKKMHELSNEINEIKNNNNKQINELKNELNEKENIIQRITNEKIDLLKAANNQINKLRDFIVQYQNLRK